jgi:hypothetical protein
MVNDDRQLAPGNCGPSSCKRSGQRLRAVRCASSIGRERSARSSRTSPVAPSTLGDDCCRHSSRQRGRRHSARAASGGVDRASCGLSHVPRRSVLYGCGRRIATVSADLNLRQLRLSGGRRWWAHFEFTRMNTTPMFLCKKYRGFARGGRVYRGRTFALRSSRSTARPNPDCRTPRLQRKASQSLWRGECRLRRFPQAFRPRTLSLVPARGS